MATAAVERSDREILDELLALEVDAVGACLRAVEAVRSDPLTRGALLSFLSEHEQHASALEALGARRRAPPGRDHGPFEGANAALKQLRADAELAVRRYRAAMVRASPTFVPAIRAQCNAWLRHRAWLVARIDAFAPRPSRGSIA